MNETKFTPGEWRVTKPGYVASTVGNDRFHGVAVTLTPDGSAESEHDALLIAAAPDLYAALSGLAGSSLCFCSEAARTRDWNGKHTPECIAACAALAKARGEEPK